MNREQLIQRLNILYHEAKDSGQLPAAGTLTALIGALCEGKEVSLMMHVGKWVDKRKEEIKRKSEEN